MNGRVLLGLGVLMVTVGCGGGSDAPVEEEQAPAEAEETAADRCEPVGDIQFICDLIGPEDLAVVPDSEWVIASGNQAGGRIQLVSIIRKSARVLYPSFTSPERLDTETYPNCPGPIDPTEGDEFRAHGLYLKTGEDRVHTLYVVHHGFRESIEVFEFDAGVSPPSLTWIGCAVTPPGTVLNSVAAIPDGGFVTTATRLEGEVETGVFEWQTATGWQLVPGSEDIRPNGIEISNDGKVLYVAGWQDERFIKLSRGVTPVQQEVVQLGFRPDNLRMASDGSIYASGHTNFQTPSEAFNVAKVDPETLEFERIFHHPVIEGFAAATTAIPVGDDIWLGTNRGEMIGYFPAP